jgi:hypothetical protein
VEHFAIQTGVAAADYCQKKRLHLPKAFRQLGRERPMVVVKSFVTFLPGFGSLAQELFAKVLTDERMRIELAGIVRIFSCEKFRSS